MQDGTLKAQGIETGTVLLFKDLGESVVVEVRASGVAFFE